MDFHSNDLVLLLNFIYFKPKETPSTNFFEMLRELYISEKRKKLVVLVLGGGVLYNEIVADEKNYALTYKKIIDEVSLVSDSICNKVLFSSFREAMKKINSFSK